MDALDGGTRVADFTEWSPYLVEATTEVFSMMVGSAITVPTENDLPMIAHITGMVGIAGAISGVFSLRCSEQSAAKVASQMLALPIDQAAAQQSDAIGEICNMVAGHFKAKIGLGDKCMLSVPTVISGKNYQLRSVMHSWRLELPVLYEGEPVWIALEVRKK